MPRPYRPLAGVSDASSPAVHHRCVRLCVAHQGGVQVATNLALDDTLIEQARRAGKHRTKKEAVTSSSDSWRARRTMSVRQTCLNCVCVLGL